MNNHSAIGGLSESDIEEVLSNQIVGHLGCHADGKTYVVPVSYAYGGDCLYFHAYEGMKIKMMRRNPNVCFQVDARKNMGNWKSVIVWGTFQELQGEDRKTALQALRKRQLPILSSITTHLGKLWPFPQQDTLDMDGIFFRILISERTGRSEVNQFVPRFVV